MRYRLGIALIHASTLGSTTDGGTVSALVAPGSICEAVLAVLAPARHRCVAGGVGRTGNGGLTPVLRVPGPGPHHRELRKVVEPPGEQRDDRTTLILERRFYRYRPLRLSARSHGLTYRVRHGLSAQWNPSNSYRELRSDKVCAATSLARAYGHDAGSRKRSDADEYVAE